MAPQARSLQLVKDIVAAGFSIESSAGLEGSFIVPVKRRFAPPVAHVLVDHEKKLLSRDTFGVWVYITAACYERKNIRNVGLFLRTAAICQTHLLSRGYEYDKLYNCSDGTIVLGKVFPIPDALKELREIHSFLTV
ncbi:MAG: hypothetical protein AAB727_02220 [Patescibacteria group bacterium]